MLQTKSSSKRGHSSLLNKRSEVFDQSFIINLQLKISLNPKHRFELNNKGSDGNDVDARTLIDI